MVHTFVKNRRRRLLSRTFFARMFENDLFSSSASTSNAVIWLLAALATPGVMFSGSQYYFYAHARTFTPGVQDRILFVSQAFHVDFAMAMAGLVTMLVWTSLAPDRRDALVLGPLPIEAGEQARARLIALLRFFAMFAAAVALPTAVAFTFVTVGDASIREVPARIGGHVASTLFGAAFVFFALIDFQLLVAATLGPRGVRLITWPLQCAAVLAMVAAISLTGRLADALLADDVVVQWRVMWNPAAWFVGVYRWIAGDSREVFALLASRATLALALSAGLAVLVYPLAYTRSLEKAIATEGQRASRWSGAIARFWLRAMSPLLRTPLERGLAAFIVASVTRSHTHRFLIGSYVGVALLFALPLSARLLQPADTQPIRYAWFSIPLGLLCWTTAALRVAMMLPVEPQSNWIFKLTEPVDKTRVLSSAVAVIQGAAAFPIAAAFGVAAGVAHGPTLGAMVFAVVLTAGGILTELVTLTLRAVPGTCTYRPGKLRLRVLWPVYLATWIAIAYVLPNLAIRALDSGRTAIVLFGVLTAMWLLLGTRRIKRARQLDSLVYDDKEPPVTTTIGLSSSQA